MNFWEYTPFWAPYRHQDSLIWKPQKQCFFVIPSIIFNFNEREKCFANILVLFQEFYDHFKALHPAISSTNFGVGKENGLGVFPTVPQTGHFLAFLPQMAEGSA